VRWPGPPAANRRLDGKLARGACPSGMGRQCPLGAGLFIDDLDGSAAEGTAAQRAGAYVRAERRVSGGTRPSAQFSVTVIAIASAIRPGCGKVIPGWGVDL
jgi:hypothetical protein